MTGLVLALIGGGLRVPTFGDQALQGHFSIFCCSFTTILERAKSYKSDTTKAYKVTAACHFFSCTYASARNTSEQNAA